MRPPYLRAVQWLVMLAWMAAIALWPRPGHAQAAHAGYTDVRFEMAGDAVRMTGNIRFTLSEAVQDTLAKGVPVYFQFETHVQQSRWYWLDKSMQKRTRYIKLAYQPLTRKWRVNMGPEPLNRGGTGVSLNQTFDSLQAALGVIQRISSWEVLQKSDWSADGSFTLDVRFRLDAAQLQLPLQIGNTASSDWNIDLRRQFRLGPQDIKASGG